MTTGPEAEQGDQSQEARTSGATVAERDVAGPVLPSAAALAPTAAERQLRFFKALAGVLALILIAGGALYVYRQHAVQPVSVLVNGKVVATLDSYKTANELVGKTAAAQLGSAFAADGKPRPRETVTLQRVSGDSTLDTLDAAVAKLGAAVHFTTLADVILIDGHTAVGLPNKEMAQAALDAVRKHYAALPPPDPVLDKPQFREKVTIERERVPASLCKSDPEEAARLLLTPPTPKTYLVQPHQTGWAIARKFHMAFADFLRANSGHDVNRLAPGDSVNVSQTFPPLSVLVRKESSATESIVAGAAGDAAGSRRVTSVTTYLNGTRIGVPTPVAIYTLHRAKPSANLR